MNALVPRHAWQPITPRGVAAFAAASLGRLLVVQLLVAALGAAVAAWFVSACWFPVAREAVQRLPEDGAIRNGGLQWTNDTPARLAENRWFALVVDAHGAGGLGRASDVELALRGSSWAVASLLGVLEFGYPEGVEISLGRAEAIPWWGAWEGPVLALTAVGVVVFLMVSWWVLATLYCPVARAFGFLANRRLGWRASWRLSGAALMPGALVVMAGVICYGALGVDLLQLGLFYLLHLITGWVYIAASPFFLPRDPEVGVRPANPFVPPPPDPVPAPAAAPVPPPSPAVAENPFAPPAPGEPGSENPFAERRPPPP